jgi:hypothetical protein
VRGLPGASRKISCRGCTERWGLGWESLDSRHWRIDRGAAAVAKASAGSAGALDPTQTGHHLAAVAGSAAIRPRRIPNLRIDDVICPERDEAPTEGEVAKTATGQEHRRPDRLRVRGPDAAWPPRSWLRRQVCCSVCVDAGDVCLCCCVINFPGSFVEVRDPDPANDYPTVDEFDEPGHPRPPKVVRARRFNRLLAPCHDSHSDQLLCVCPPTRRRKCVCPISR